MATSDVVMEADSGFARYIRFPGSSDRIINVNGRNVNEFDEGRDEMIGEGLFSFDEDMVPEKETGNLNEGSAMSGLFYTDQPNDSGNIDISHAHLNFNEGGTDMIVRGRHPENSWVEENDLRSSSVELEGGESEPIQRTGSVAYSCSLPITIPSGRFWPPHDAIDSIEGNQILNFDENRKLIDKTILPQRPPRDPYSEMRAQARSIQAADDPERLFGERPSRRRYKTGGG